jgi:transposase
MEDGAPVHRNVEPKKKLRGLYLLEKMEWPANSPDLNPIENLWMILKDAIQRRRYRLENVEQMLEEVKKEWDLISPETLEGLVESMPQRILAVIKAGGGHTRW